MAPAELDRVLLGRLADVLIPGEDGMPSATDADVGGTWIDTVLTVRPDLREPLCALLSRAADATPEQVVWRLRDHDPAAFAKAGENVHSGADVLTSLWGGGSAAGTREESSGGLSYAEAAGYASAGSWAADTPWQGGQDRAQQKAPLAQGHGKPGAGRDSARGGLGRRSSDEAYRCTA